MDLEVKTLPAMRLAAVPHSGPYNLIGPAFHTLGGIAGPAGLFAKPGAMMMGIYKDDPGTTAPDELRPRRLSIAEMPCRQVSSKSASRRRFAWPRTMVHEQLGNSWMRVKTELMPASRYSCRPARATIHTGYRCRRPN